MTSRFVTGLLIVAATLIGDNSWAQTYYGRIVGTPGISPTGSAQYTIPLITPPGVHGVQPALALVYDSGVGYGMMGPGWSLSGLSVISVCNQTYAQDASPNPVTLTSADVFCVDGNRLRLTSGSYGAANSVYQTEIANFSQYTASSTLTGVGPSYFTVQGKDGLTYEYGNTATSPNSQILAPGSSPLSAYAWALDQVTDRYGNHMIYTYDQEANGGFVIASIQYTAAAGSSSFPYVISFAYTTKSAADTKTVYIAGSFIQQTEQLASVTIAYDGTNVRQYQLNYTLSTETQRQTLTSIQECVGSALNECLPGAQVTKATYQQGVLGISAPTTATGSATSGIADTISADMNGDGRADLVYATATGSTYKWYVQFATATGYQAPVYTGIQTTLAQNVLIDNFEGGIQNEFLVASGGYWYEYKWNTGSNSFAPTNTLLQTPTVPNGSVIQYSSADVNGDGYPDLVYMITGSCCENIYVQLNTFATESPLSFGQAAQTVVNAQWQGAAIIGDNQLNNSSIKKFDFDGDGRQDLLVSYTHTNQNTGAETSEVLQLLSRGTGLMVIGTQLPGNNFMAANFNDDACTDLFLAGTTPQGANDSEIYESACNGNAASVITLNGVTPYLAVDWDGDGRTDLVVQNGTMLEVFLSQGNQLAATGITTNIAAANCCTVTDQNGDGLDDLVGFGSSGLSYGLHNGAGQKPDLLSSITDGYGNSFSPSYTSLVGSANYVIGADAPDGYQNYIGPMYVVNLATYSDPSNPGGTYTQAYTYLDAWMYVQGQIFAGFAQTQMTDSRYTNPPLVMSEFYQQLYPYTGMHWQEIVTETSPTGQKVSQWTGTPATLTLSNANNETRVFPYMSPVTTTQWEMGGTIEPADTIITTSSTTSSYDNYGNALVVATTTTDTDPNSLAAWKNQTWTTTTTNTISADTNTWCLNLPTAVQVQYTSSISAVTPVSLQDNYTPDYTHCNQETKVTAQGSAYQVTEQFGYDGFGNLASDEVTGTGMATRTTTVNWGASGQLPTVITDAAGEQVTLGYDFRFGTKTSQTDPNYTSTTNKNLVTYWTVDDFGRLATESRPDGTSTSWSPQQCSGCPGTVGRMEVIQQRKTTAPSTVITESIFAYDPLDRLYAQADEQASGAYSYSLLQYYDSLGRVASKSFPFLTTGTSPGAQSFQYDSLNRPTQVQQPKNGSNNTPIITTYSYGGRQTVTYDWLNNATTTYTQVTGLLGRTVDAYGFYVTLGYDAYGSLLTAQDATQTGSTFLYQATYAYGIKPIQTSVSDLDLGAHTGIVVDALGELTNYTDANGNTFVYSFDPISRPKTRTETLAHVGADLTTVWNWGSTASSYNIGKLASVTATNGQNGQYSETYNYDSFTRLSSKVITLSGDPYSPYTYSYGYSPTTGLQSTLTYPASPTTPFQIQYGYTNGILSSITNSATPSTTYWTLQATDARGHVTQESLGNSNSVVTTRTFDAVTGTLGTMQAVAGSTTLQSSAYGYDEVGDLIQRQDLVRNLTESMFYDNDYRFTCSTLNNASSCTNPNLTVTYSNNGNIATRSDIQGGAPWTYDPVHIHAVTSIGTDYAQYDANGNMTSRDGQVNTWTSYNLPTGLNTKGGEYATFAYGPYHQRVLTQYSNSTLNINEQTYRIGGLLERVVYNGINDWRYYVKAGNELIGVYSTAAAAMRYTLLDQEGSYSTLYPVNTPSQTVPVSFTAFGNRRSGETWTGSPGAADVTTIDAVSRDGYTGQTVLGVTMGLNHLNGRVQDAITGRMLSPDPIVQSPGSTQSWNRYSYVFNNPLTYIDPTGYCGFDVTYNAGSDATYDTDDDGNIVEVTPVTPGSYSFSPIPGACFPPGTNAFGGGGAGGQKSGKSPAQSPQHILGCFAKGAAMGAVAAVGVGALAVGAVVLGAPIAAVTAVLGVAGVAGGAFAVANTAVQLNAGNYAGAAFNVGSIAGGVAVGASGGGRALAQGINGVPSPPWSIGSDLSQGYNPNLGSVGDWLATGPNPGSAAATATGVGAAVSQFLSGCN